MPFQKGHNLSKGRPKGSHNAITKEIFEDLLSAMKAVKKNETVSKGKDILIHFIERAYENDTVLCALMKKLVADRQQTKVDLDEEIKIGVDVGSMPDEGLRKLIRQLDGMKTKE